MKVIFERVGKHSRISVYNPKLITKLCSQHLANQASQPLKLKKHYILTYGSSGSTWRFSRFLLGNG